MSTVLQLSDTHFGTEQPEVVEALLRLAHAQRPDLLILSGDVTQRARPRQFRAALHFLERLGIAASVILPGNHDIPLFNVMARILSPYGSHRRFLGAELEPEFESEDLLVLGVNTTRPGRHTVGRVSREQIERVGARLRGAAAQQLRVVVTHQPVHVVRDIDGKNVLRGHREAVQAWSAAGADLIVGGHIHLPYVRPLAEVYPDLPRPVWSIQAGTAVSHRTRAAIPNSVNLIRYQPEESPPYCTVERWDHDESSDAFLVADSHLLHLHRWKGGR